MATAITSFWQGDDENELCPTLTFQQRIYGFGGCLVLGFLCAILAWIAVFQSNWVQFGIFITFSNVSAISGSLFLAGPKKQAKKMFEETRWIATAVYFTAMVATLVAAFAIKQGWLVIICCVFQYLAMIWYGLSYIPFARAAVKNCFKGAAASATSAA
jgi:hypothetical protein